MDDFNPCSQHPRLAIVVPCYNEEAVLPHSLQTLLNCLTDLIDKDKIAPNSFLYCVDDGSQDFTWDIIHEWHKKHGQIRGLKLSRNVGHQNALFAGLMGVKRKVHCAISIDADLQDDVSAIEDMIDAYRAGHDIVYGVRQERKQDSIFKRLTAHIFYRLMKQSGADITANHADFRLLSRRTLLKLSRFKERNLFLRGLFPLIGYRSTHVYYDRTRRLHGDSKYTLTKMLSLAWDGLISFSHIPLNFILLFGVVSFILSICMMVWVVLAKLIAHPVPGWSSIMIPLCFMGGVQLLSIGILGEYIAKVYLEVKRRPRFIKDVEL